MIIRNPQYGNSWTLDLGVQIDHAAGGTLLQFVESNRPVIRKLKITIANMSNIEKVKLESLLVNSAGEELEIDDGEGRVWKGVFTTDPIEFTRVGRGCKWQIDLEYEGQVTSPIAEKD